MDNDKLYCVKPGTSTPRFDDVDFALVNGTWYKIGMFTFDVTEQCGPDDGYSGGTQEDLTSIEAKLKAQGKNPGDPCN
jgi:hypothetical protein